MEDGEFITEAGALVNFRNCTFSGSSTGLSEEHIGVATGNIKTGGASLSFPANVVNGEIFEE